jgi:ParB-like chromosome segregation protein Spo0J
MPDGVKTQMIALRGIAITPDRMRKLRPEVVTELAESIRERGLLTPIIVRPRTRGAPGYILVTGRHRLEEVKKLKLEAIRVEVRDGLDADAALLAEIDENLIRADLTPAERALHIGERKRLYETLHPETKHGGAPGKAGGGKKRKAKDAKSASFAEQTAKATGKSKRSVSVDATRAKKVKVLADVAGTSLDRGNQLDALAKLPEHQQHVLAERAKAGEKVSAEQHVNARRLAPENSAVGNGVDPEQSAEQRKAEAQAEVPRQQEVAINPFDRCTMRVRAVILEIMEEMQPNEWKDLLMELRDELDDIEKVAERRRSELRT